MQGDDMKLEKLPYAIGHKTGTISGLSADEICVRLGYMETVPDDEAKVAYSWAFLADDKKCGIWDYYGSASRLNFSTYGPHDVFVELFGDHYTGGPHRDFD
jgi:hypothetical protein